MQPCAAIGIAGWCRRGPRRRVVQRRLIGQGREFGLCRFDLAQAASGVGHLGILALGDWANPAMGTAAHSSRQAAHARDVDM